jgi:hypothetical protein
MQNTSFTFEFVNVEKPYESYTGSNVRLRYWTLLHYFLSFINLSVICN